MEGECLKALTDGLDNVHLQEAKEALQDNTCNAASPKQHTDDSFTTNTQDGSLSRLADWRFYCTVVYNKVVPEVADIKWPPTESEWKQILLAARPKVSSIKGLEHVVASVCWVASRHMARNLGSLPEAYLWAPRKKYPFKHCRTMGLLRREYGVGLQQVEAIIMAEFKNATCFADHDSVQGMAECAAFTLADLFDGQRARSLTAVKLRDVKLFASDATADKQHVLVPALEITFTEEKFADLRSHKKARDVPHSEDYSRKRWYCSAFWICRLLVARGVFLHADPILHAQFGEELVIRPECVRFILFCTVIAVNY